MGQIFTLHRAPRYQPQRTVMAKRTIVNLIHLRSLDSNKQAGPFWERPGYKEGKRALATLQKAQGSRVSYIPMDLTTRQNNKLDPAVQEYLEWSIFHWTEDFAETQKFRTPTNHHHHPHLQAGHQAQHGGVRYLGTKVGKNGTHMGGKT